MTKYPNRDALRDAHDIYLNAMRPFITDNALGVIEGEIDFGDIAHIISKDWSDSFKLWFEDVDPYYDARSAAWQIVESRNRASHPPWDLDSEFTRAHLFLIANILGKIKNSDAKRRVEDIRNGLFSDDHGEQPAQLDQVTAYKKRFATMSTQLAKVISEKTTAEERLSDISHRLEETEKENTAYKKRVLDMSNQLRTEKAKFEQHLAKSEVAKAEIAELKKRLSETENHPKAVEPERYERINTLLEQLADSEERFKNSQKQMKTGNVVKTELEERFETTSTIKEWRKKIWKQLCDYAAQKDTPVRFHKPGSDNYLNVSRSLIDFTGFRMNVWLGTDNRKIAIRLYMSKQDFYILEKRRKEIEQEFCESLEWEKLPQRRESRISLRKDVIDPTDESDWQNQHEWVISKLEKFHKKFNEVFLLRIQELNTSDSLSEDEEDLPLNPATPNSVTFQGTTFTKRLNKYRIEGDEITQTFWHYWHSQGHEGKQEMRDAGWSVEKINDDWEVTISPEDFEAWIVYTESQSYSESPAKSSKSQRKWRRLGAVAALRDPAEIQEAEAKIAKILNPNEKSRLERELREAKRAAFL